MTPAERERAASVVRARMRELGLNPTSLARRAEVAPSTVRRFLKGKHTPSDETRRRLADALDWKVGEGLRLMSGADLAAIPTDTLLDELKHRCP